ncbi:MAG: hypothetical protein KDC92_06155, partial [Bacteroidetes bacterium]|nr:hypothetical protein [Bacteroidota bacterium]
MKLSFPFQLIVFIVILLNSAFAQSRFKEYSPKNPANYGHYGNKMVSVDSFLFVRSYEQRDTFFLQNGTLRIINSGAIVVYKVKPNGTLEHYQNLLPDSAYYDAGLPLGMTTNNGSVLATYRKNRLDSLLTYEGVRMVEFKLINNKWAQVSEVKLPKRKSYNSQMGVVLDAEGNLAVVGDWWEDFDENGQDSQLHAGAVYIYEKVNDNWEFQKKLVSNDRKRGSSFGGAVAIHKGRIFSSAINWAVKDPTSSGFIGGVGKVYVYENITGNWVEVDTILSPTPFVSAQFGVQLCFDNNELFVSEPNSRLDSNGVRRDSNAIGAVHIFELDVNGKYTHKQRLQPKQLETFLYFGNSISKKGNQLIVGAPGRDIFNGSIRTHYSVGSVYRYYYANGKYKEIEELALPASLRESEDFFGDEVQIIGDILVVAAWAKDSTNNGNQVLNRMGKIYTTNIPTKTYLDTVHLCNNETFMGWHFDKPQQLTFPFVSKS